MSDHMRPLRVLIAAQKAATFTTHSTLVIALQRAFQGGLSEAPDGSEKYYAIGDELGVEVMTVAWEKIEKTPIRQAIDPEKLCDSAKHIFVVVLLEEATNSTSNSPFGKWLDRLSTKALKTHQENRIGILPVALDTGSCKAEIGKLTQFQTLFLHDLGEHALRPGHLGLLALQKAWGLLSHSPDDRLKVFISHAKKDGVAIAAALKTQVQSYKWLQPIYDACDILPGAPWLRVLESGVRNSAVVILRTDIYEQRPMCLQEIRWTEEFGCAAVVVDLRLATVMHRESLPVTGMVTVTISDGNLLRILNAVLREAVRVRLFQRSVEELKLAQDTYVVIPRPSLTTMGHVFERFLHQHTYVDENPGAEKDPAKVEWVLTAEPFRGSLRNAANQLVEAYFENATLATPREAMPNLPRPKGTRSKRAQQGIQNALRQHVVGISIAASEDAGDFGYQSGDENRITVRLAEALLASGARLLFGHDWRPDGIMDAICRLASQYQLSTDPNAPLITSLLPWPVQTQLEPSLRRELEQTGILKIENMPRPRLCASSMSPELEKAVALSEMRVELAKRSTARICIGGKAGTGNGFFPGVAEEAYRQITEQKPLFIGCLFGGASAKIVNYLKKGPRKKTTYSLKIMGKNGLESKELSPSIFEVIPTVANVARFKSLESRTKDLNDELKALEKSQENSDMTNDLSDEERHQERRDLERSLAVCSSPNDLASSFDNAVLQTNSGLIENDWDALLNAPDAETFVNLVIKGLEQSSKKPNTKKSRKSTTRR